MDVGVVLLIEDSLDGEFQVRLAVLDDGLTCRSHRSVAEGAEVRVQRVIEEKMTDRPREVLGQGEKPVEIALWKRLDLRFGLHRGLQDKIAPVTVLDADAFVVIGEKYAVGPVPDGHRIRVFLG